MTREEAIDKLTRLCSPEQMTALRVLVPELRESDDERIRKAIMKIVGAARHSQMDLINDATADAILAWLEKQKPILEVFGFKVGDAVRLKDGDGRKHIIKSFKEVTGLNGPNFYHVEFEDNSARAGIYPGKQYLKGYYTQMEKFEEEQKPKEKSKKPIIPEWSEEDEKMLNNTLDSLKRYQLSMPNFQVELQMRWLKSLRPQPRWKPSEEQMKILRKYVMGEWRDLTIGQDKILTSLYNDLESL